MQAEHAGPGRGPEPVHPNLPGLKGTAFYTSFVTVGATTRTYNPVKIVVQ